jgi:hypothetical protein
VIRPAVTIRRVSVPGHDNLDTHFGGAPHDCVKIVDLEPKQHSIPVRPVVEITDRTMMVFHLQAV